MFSEWHYSKIIEQKLKEKEQLGSHSSDEQISFIEKNIERIKDNLTLYYNENKEVSCKIKCNDKK